MIGVSVIVPARNAAATLGDALEALERQDLAAPYEVLVVDDGSEDDTIAIAERAGEKVAVIRQQHRGPGPARNLGARRARGEVLAFTDADCVPAVDWLRRGIAALGGADLVQGAVVADPDAVRGPFDHTIWVTRQSGLYEAANLFVKRELFHRLEGFEHPFRATIGKPLGEDVWFGWKARRDGARTVFCADALVHHAVLPRSAGEYVLDRRRLAYFPPLVRRIPELRDEFLYHRWFLSPRSAALDAGLVGLAIAAAAVVLGATPLVGVAVPACVPYGIALARRLVRSGLPGARLAAVDLTADLVGLGSLIAGSVRHRTLVL